LGEYVLHAVCRPGIKRIDPERRRRSAMTEPIQDNVNPAARSTIGCEAASLDRQAVQGRNVKSM
jgi:hypothetical protein